MKQWTRSKIMNGLQEKVNEINNMKKSETFLGKKGGIVATWKTSWFYKGLPVFDYDAEEYGELSLSEVIKTIPILGKMKIKTIYVNGVNREIHNWLEDRGWYPKWFDRSTIFFLPYDIKGYGV